MINVLSMKSVLKNLFILFLIPLAAFAYTPQPGSPLANHSHPRLHLTQASLPEIRNILSSEYAADYQAHVTWAANQSTNNEDNIISEAGHNPLRALMVHQAFIAAVGTVPGINYPISLDEFANRAISRLISQLNSGEELSYVAALTYDWTYNYMTSAQRSQIANLMVNRRVTHKVFNFSIANPNANPEQMFSSKYFEGCYPWYIALAFWGDGLIDAAADNAVDTFFSTMLNYGYLDAHNFAAGDGGGWTEWIGYSSWHPRTHLLLIDGWRTATNEDYVTQNTMGGNAIKNYSKFMAYAMDPHKYFNQYYTYVRMGGAQTTDASLEHLSMQQQMLTLPRIYVKSGMADEAGLLRQLIDQYDVGWPHYQQDILWIYLGLARSVAPKTAVELGLQHSLWSKNLGIFLARTGFDNDAEGVFSITASHFTYDGHEGPDDFNGFGLVKFGTLVNTRYVAHRGYGNLNDYPGATKDNTVIFDGGHSVMHPSIDEPSELQSVFNGQGSYDQGGIEQVTARDGSFYHVRINLDRQLATGFSHTREYLWMPGSNPQTDSDFLIVYDRTSGSSTPHWTYHVPWLPEAGNYSSSEDISTGSGTTDRIGTAYLGSNILIKELNSLGGEQDNDGGTASYTGGGVAHGVAFVRTILPANSRVEVTRVARFDNDVLNRQGPLAIKSHRWQVDVIPQQTANEHEFLNVFQTADANSHSSMTATSLIEVGNVMQGVWIQKESANQPNYVALFTKQNQVTNSAVTYTVSGTGTVKHVIVGLNSYTNYDIVDENSGSSTTFSRTTEPGIQVWDYKGVATNYTAGVLYFETSISGSHTYRITISGTQNTTPPQTPTNLRVTP